MIKMPTGTNLYNALLAEGFPLPEECGDVQMTLPVEGLIQLHYTVTLTGENLAKLGRALTKLGDEAKDAKAVLGFESKW